MEKLKLKNANITKKSKNVMNTDCYAVKLKNMVFKVYFKMVNH